jgi:hypothetical protein
LVGIVKGLLGGRRREEAQQRFNSWDLRGVRGEGGVEGKRKIARRLRKGKGGVPKKYRKTSSTREKKKSTCLTLPEAKNDVHQIFALHLGRQKFFGGILIQLKIVTLRRPSQTTESLLLSAFRDTDGV